MNKLVSQSPSSCYAASVVGQPDVRGASPGHDISKSASVRGSACGVGLGWLPVVLIALCAAQSFAQLNVKTVPFNNVKGNEPVVVGVEWTGEIAQPPDLAPFLRRDAEEVTAAGWSLEAVSGNLQTGETGGRATRMDGEGITFHDAPGWVGGASYLLSGNGLRVSILSLPPPYGGIYNYSWPSGPSSRIATLADLAALDAGGGPSTDTLMDVTQRGDEADSMKVRRERGDIVVAGGSVLVQGPNVTLSWNGKFFEGVHGGTPYTLDIGGIAAEAHGFAPNTMVPKDAWVLSVWQFTPGMFLGPSTTMPGEGVMSYVFMWQYLNGNWTTGTGPTFLVDTSNVLSAPGKSYEPVAAVGDPITLYDTKQNLAGTIFMENGGVYLRLSTNQTNEVTQ